MNAAKTEGYKPPQPRVTGVASFTLGAASSDSDSDGESADTMGPGPQPRKDDAVISSLPWRRPSLADSPTKPIRSMDRRELEPWDQSNRRPSASNVGGKEKSQVEMVMERLVSSDMSPSTSRRRINPLTGKPPASHH